MALDVKVAAITKLALFAGFEPEALRLMAFAAQPIKFSAGETVFRSGESLDGGFLILSGALKLGSQSIDEGDTRTVGPGMLIGERALMTTTRNLYTATAQEDTTVLKISRHLVRRVLEEFPASAAAMQKAATRAMENVGADIEMSRQSMLG